jgi:hypothetical protein
MSRHFAIISLMVICLTGARALAQDQITVHGIVRDAKTHLPISCAIVSAVGDQAAAPDCTDGDGQFDIILNKQIKIGAQIRIRVQKENYASFDKKEVASPNQIIQVELTPLPSVPAQAHKIVQPASFVHIDADAVNGDPWVLRVQAISPVQHYDIKIQAVLLGIPAGTVRTVSKPLALDLRPGNVPNNYIAYPNGMGTEAAICYTARASGQNTPMRLTEVFKVQFASGGAVLVPNHEPTLEPASNAPCGDAHVIQTFQQQQKAAAKEAAMADPASPSAKPAPAANREGTYYDPSTSLMWTLKDSGEDVNYPDARNYCTNLELAGFRDWRLPLEEELQALYDSNNPRKLTGPSRPETVFVRGTIELSGSRVWSGTPSTQTAGGYRMVQVFDFAHGRVFGNIVVAINSSVLCVR